MTPLLKHIRGIFFDAAGTLFTPHPSVGAVYASVAQQFGSQATACELDQAFHQVFSKRGGLAALGTTSNELREKAWWRQVVVDTFRELSPPTPFDAFFEELYDTFSRASAWYVYPDVVPVLTQLKARGLTLAIVSNWDSRLFLVCDHLHLTPFFDLILPSVIAKATKPHAAIFQKALRQLGLAARDVIHVGDSWQDDVEGARAAGLEAFFLNRAGKAQVEAPTIRSLQELIA